MQICLNICNSPKGIIWLKSHMVDAIDVTQCPEYGRWGTLFLWWLFTIIYIVFPASPFYYSYTPVHCEDTNMREKAHIHYITKWGGCESIDQEIKAGLKGPLPHFDPPTSGASLKSLNSSFSSSYIPAVGCWVHTISLRWLRKAKGQSAKVSFKSTTSHPNISLHRT